MISNIQNDDEYYAALERIDEIWNAEVGSTEYEELGNLCISVMAYEEETWPLTEPSRFQMFIFNCDRLGGWRSIISKVYYFITDMCLNISRFF